MGIGTAIAAGGTAFSALIADRTTEAERPPVLSVVWGMRLLGVLLGSVLVNQVCGSACAVNASRTAVLAVLALLLMLWACSGQSIPLLRTAVGLFGLSLGVCMNACLTLLSAWNGGDLFAAYGGVFGLQIVCFLGAALMTRRLDVVAFRHTVKTRFADVMEMTVD